MRSLRAGKDTVGPCARVPGEDGAQIDQADFGTTNDLLALRDRLCSRGVTLVGMESTGLYLLGEEIEAWPLNARHLRDVPGRKTVIADAAWIALLEHSLVRPHSVLPTEIRELSDPTRYRTR
jgi:transposase